jgi:hypothetical protein
MYKLGDIFRSQSAIFNALFYIYDNNSSLRCSSYFGRRMAPPFRNMSPSLQTLLMNILSECIHKLISMLSKLCAAFTLPKKLTLLGLDFSANEQNKIESYVKESMSYATITQYKNNP